MVDEISPKPIEIYVDADACPVKAEIFRVARRYAITVHVVANAYMAVPDDPLIRRAVVGSGFDAVDVWIAERAIRGDIVVTADIPLVARCLDTGAIVIGPTGRVFTGTSIGIALADRELMAHLRATGEAVGGPRPMQPRDRSRFLSALDDAVVQLRRAARQARPADPVPGR